MGHLENFKFLWIPWHIFYVWSWLSVFSESKCCLESVQKTKYERFFIINHINFYSVKLFYFAPGRSVVFDALTCILLVFITANFFLHIHNHKWKQMFLSRSWLEICLPCTSYQLVNYRPETKLREGNVFTPVSQSFCLRGGMGVCIPACNGGVHPPCRHPHGQTQRCQICNP